MKNEISTVMNVKENKIRILKVNDMDYISLTDLARYKNPEEPKDVVKNWLRNRSTIEFLSLWEELYNPNSKGVDFHSFISNAGSHSFTMSPQKWISLTNAIGIISKSGNNGGTYAHSDIALEFASWIDTAFKLYLIKEFERLKKDECYHNKQEWNIRRILAKTNYKIHTDAIKNNIVPNLIGKKELSYVYINEADVINVALFNKTARIWRKDNPDLKGNMRDYADIRQLIVLSNLENLNAIFIKQNMARKERLLELNRIAIEQLTLLEADNSINKIVDSDIEQNID